VLRCSYNKDVVTSAYYIDEIKIGVQISIINLNFFLHPQCFQELQNGKLLLIFEA